MIIIHVCYIFLYKYFLYCYTEHGWDIDLLCSLCNMKYCLVMSLLHIKNKMFVLPQLCIGYLYAHHNSFTSASFATQYAPINKPIHIKHIKPTSNLPFTSQFTIQSIKSLSKQLSHYLINPISIYYQLSVESHNFAFNQPTHHVFSHYVTYRFNIWSTDYLCKQSTFRQPTTYVNNPHSDNWLHM